MSILDFGAFIEILPGKEGLLHVPEIAWNKTEKVEDVLAVGDEVDVKLLEIDAKTGKMRLSMRALTEKPEGYKEPERRPRGGNDRGNGGERRGADRADRGERRGGDRGDRGERRGGERGERREGGRENRGGEHRGGDRPRRSFGPRNEAPAPSFDDFKETVDEVF